MALEATVICLDNSNYSRNGDYGTSRMLQQQDATNFLSGVKTQQNPENLVGILSMAGERIELRVTPTSDLSKTMHAMDGIRLSGKIDLLRGIQIAQLALKHRLNKNLRQRIVCFVGSPLEDDLTEKQLEKLGKVLKKNNVSIDIISFGEILVNRERLQALVNAANNDNTSNFVEIAAPTNLTDALMSSPIVLGEGASSRVDADGFGETNGDMSGFEFGIDPNADPELYMALRMSMEEERNRQMRLEGNSARNSSSADAGSSTQGQSTTTNNFDSIPTINEINAMEVDDELRQALLLSIQDFSGNESNNNNDSNSNQPQDTSSSENTSNVTINSNHGNNADSGNSNNPNSIEGLIQGIPGVDINDPRIQDALRQLKNDQEDKKDKQ
ncbi:26s proteasome regulatory subunit 5A [Cryptosporidium ubiquitum]|uniref:26s proteasome regulatory subunit 5A n=1 Tax=Cryptosporidium ubiquitum TaxID=857276 RepID=A0A1J4MFS1_9CRYT|nr:26s proteasome regulatory subunit 5A [Cryptosporidium ubiquitum]OII71685.1 26s proteasome regulatory subunit 5A [Cryptosporidium ubiquitum]